MPTTYDALETGELDRARTDHPRPRQPPTQLPPGGRFGASGRRRRGSRAWGRWWLDRAGRRWGCAVRGRLASRERRLYRRRAALALPARFNQRALARRVHGDAVFAHTRHELRGISRAGGVTATPGGSLRTARLRTGRARAAFARATRLRLRRPCARFGGRTRRMVSRAYPMVGRAGRVAATPGSIGGSHRGGRLQCRRPRRRDRRRTARRRPTSTRGQRETGKQRRKHGHRRESTSPVDDLKHCAPRSYTPRLCEWTDTPKRRPVL